MTGPEDAGRSLFDRDRPAASRSRKVARNPERGQRPGEAATEVLVTSESLEERVRRMGAEIAAGYAGRVPLLIGLLKGSAVFLADLMRAIEIDLEIDFISISSYQDRTSSSGSVRLVRDLDSDIDERDVLIIEDIVDSGRSLHYIRSMILARGPRSVKIAALLDKPDRRVIDVPVDYVGFRIPDRFVVGYGLDYGQLYRGLPCIAVLDPLEGSA